MLFQYNKKGLFQSIFIILLKKYTSTLLKSSKLFAYDTNIYLSIS